MFELDELARLVAEKGARISAPRSLLAINTTPFSDGSPYITIEDGDCFYVSSERGCEILREKIDDLDELLYRIFDRVTSRMAKDYELDNRIERQDCRRLIFHKKIELLEKIDQEWGCREKQRIELILTKRPYVD